MGLDPKIKDRIKEVILLLKQEPIPFRKTDVIKLRGYDSVYRVRVGALRIVYEVAWDRKTIVVQYIGPREKAYKITY